MVLFEYLASILSNYAVSKGSSFTSRNACRSTVVHIYPNFALGEEVWRRNWQRLSRKIARRERKCARQYLHMMRWRDLVENGRAKSFVL